MRRLITLLSAAVITSCAAENALQEEPIIAPAPFYDITFDGEGWSSDDTGVIEHQPPAAKLKPNDPKSKEPPFDPRDWDPMNGKL